jgi:hypothetical protein
MRTSTLLALCALCVALTGCSPKDAQQDDAAAPAAAAAKTMPTPTTPATPAVATPAPENAIPEDTQATAFGKGSFERANGKLASFEFDANYTRSGPVSGRILYSSFLDEGKIDFDAKVTCGHYDMDTKRAWIGGQITTNRSTLSGDDAKRYASGQDVWFRFEESETHPQPAAKISDIGVAGDDGFDSAASFCEKKPWSTDGLNDLSAQGAVIIFALPDLTG